MTAQHTCIVIYATFPDLVIARKIVTGLVQAKIAACGNIFKLHSIYRWKGRIERESEYGALIKTQRTQYKKAERYIKKHHPYEVPEIISWGIERGLRSYLEWIEKTTADTMR